MDHLIEKWIGTMNDSRSQVGEIGAIGEEWMNLIELIEQNL
jgi:hypothetical protein